MGKETTKKKLAIHPEEAEVVRLIYDWYVSGTGAKSIAERLNRDGYSYRGSAWSKNRILDILGDEAYIGRYYFNKKDSKTHRMKPRKEWIQIPVDPIVDEVTWKKAKALREERSPRVSKGRTTVTGAKTLLTGIAECGLCGAKMSMESAKGGRFTYYNCSNFIRRGKSTCPGQRVPARRLEKAVLDHMANKLFTADRVRAILKGVFREMKELDRRNDRERNSLNRRLEVIRRKLTKQYEAIEEGVIDLQDVAERIRELKENRSRIQERLEDLQPRGATPLHFFKDQYIENFQRTIRDLFLGEDRPLTKRYLRLFIERIVINLPRVDIEGKTDVLLAVLENKTAVRTDGVLTAVGAWLPRTDSNRRPSG